MWPSSARSTARAISSLLVTITFTNDAGVQLAKSTVRPASAGTFASWTHYPDGKGSGTDSEMADVDVRLRSHAVTVTVESEGRQPQTRRILQSFKVMLEAVGSDLDHIVHVNVFLRDIGDFEAMNAAYVDMMGEHRPARTAFAVRDLPRPDVLLTMNLTAVTREG